MDFQIVTLDNFPERPAAQFSKPIALRPIATNSRLKHDKKYRKDIYLAFVNNALQQKAMGSSETFDELVNQFNLRKPQEEGPPQAGQLRLWITALCHIVSRLENTHAALVEAIVSIPWPIMDNATVKSYTVFIGMLLSARPEYLSLTLGKIAQGFTHGSAIQSVDLGIPEYSCSPVTRRIIYDRLHDLLRHLLSLIPTLPSTLQPLLLQNFPHKRQSWVAQSAYIRNLLRITEYCEELADKILAMIIDRAIQIDVEIQVELDELEEKEFTQGSDLFDLDPFDTVVGQEDSELYSDAEDDGEVDNFSDLSSDVAGDEGEERVFPTNVQHIQDMVNKLDIILNLIFGHFYTTHNALPPSTPLPSLNPLFFESSALSSLSSSSNELVRHLSPPSLERIKYLRQTQFNTLLSIFDRIIIRTFKSRYTQFLIFWYASLDPEFSDIFQGMLVSKALLEPDQPAVTRAVAASYIGSFVSRALFVDQEGTRKVVGVLCAYLQSHLDVFEVQMQAGDILPWMGHHVVFYAVTQAVFLIFCFRWRDLLADREDENTEESLSGRTLAKQWMMELNVIRRAVISALNPLKVCSINVVMQFARVAQATDFIYCYSIIESNKRSEYASTFGTNKSLSQNQWTSIIHPALRNTMNADLNTFFPFDPYKLPKSNSYIQPVYREWTTVAIDDNEEEDEDDDAEEREGTVEFEDDEDFHLDISRSHVVNIDASELGTSLSTISISPLQLAGALTSDWSNLPVQTL